MANTIAWPALVTGGALALAAGTALVTVRGVLAPRTPDRVSWVPPVALLVCGLLVMAGVLLALWALNLRGTLGR
jgi:multisubunit Na+/H+ antiporter MnhF subunit